MSYHRMRRYDLAMTNRHAEQRRVRRKLRQWLRGLALLRLPDFRDMR